MRRVWEPHGLAFGFATASVLGTADFLEKEKATGVDFIPTKPPGRWGKARGQRGVVEGRAKSFEPGASWVSGAAWVSGFLGQPVGLSWRPRPEG